MIYFDNAATGGYKPPVVIDTMTDVLKNLSVNPGRSGHKKALEATLKIWKTRNTVKQMVNAPSEDNVVFTQNCTYALNLAIIGTVRKNGHVITSCNEHNSVLRPLHELQRHGQIELTVLSPQADGCVHAEQIYDALKPNTYLVALSHASNVTGAVNDVAAIGAVCKENNLLFLVDAAQSIGYTQIDMEKMHVNLLAFPGHKGLHAPQGTGCLCFTDDAKPRPVVYGGTGSRSDLLYQPEESPECFESGTLNTPAILALDSAIRWTATHHRKLQTTQNEIQRILYEGLQAVDGCTVYSVRDTFTGIVSFLLEDLDSNRIADILNENYGIATRSGLHCAPLVHRHLNTQHTGLVRASVSGTNTKEEAYLFLRAVNEIAKA